MTNRLLCLSVLILIPAYLSGTEKTCLLSFGDSIGDSRLVMGYKKNFDMSHEYDPDSYDPNSDVLEKLENTLCSWTTNFSKKIIKKVVLEYAKPSYFCTSSESIDFKTIIHKKSAKILAKSIENILEETTDQAVGWLFSFVPHSQEDPVCQKVIQTLQNLQALSSRSNDTDC